MSDWQIGDLALVTRAGPINCGLGKHTGDGAPPTGSVRKVVDVQISRWPDDGPWAGQPCGCVSLSLEGQWATFRRCVKITPPAADEFDRETIALMDRKPVGVPA